MGKELGEIKHPKYFYADKNADEFQLKRHFKLGKYRILGGKLIMQIKFNYLDKIIFKFSKYNNI